MSDKSFIVVGGSQGIGLEITRKLYDAGHAVLVISRSGDQLGGMNGVTHLPLDIVADPVATEAIPTPISGLAYCPGSINLRPFNRLSEADFYADWQINFLGAVKAIQACLPAMKKSTSPSSIVLFSTVAVSTGMPFHASIAAAKGAVEGLTRSLAAELAPKIRVNAIAPSLTDTPLAHALLSDDGKRSAAADRHPLKRVGKASDIAATAFLLLDDRSSWITGQVMAVDGGMSTLRTFK